MIRNEIQQLVKLGQFPASSKVRLEIITEQEKFVRVIVPPISDAEAEELIKLFGPDDYFGAEWTILDLIESAPSWPIEECLADISNEWVVRLKDRASSLSDLVSVSDEAISKTPSKAPNEKSKRAISNRRVSSFLSPTGC